MKRLPLLLAICVLSIAGLAACGDDNSSSDTTTEPAATETSPTGTTTDEAGSGGVGSETVEVAADPGGALEFEQKSLTASAGEATFELTNRSSTPHDFVLERDGEELAKTEVITDGTDTTQATLEAGEYTYFCSVPGHRQAGMEGTLTAE